MIVRCYFHQHPEDYGRAAVEEPYLPEVMRYGRDDIPASTAAIPEEAMGNPAAVWG